MLNSIPKKREGVKENTATAVLCVIEYVSEGAKQVLRSSLCSSLSHLFFFFKVYQRLAFFFFLSLFIPPFLTQTCSAGGVHISQIFFSILPLLIVFFFFTLFFPVIVFQLSPSLYKLLFYFAARKSTRWNRSGLTSRKQKKKRPHFSCSCCIFFFQSFFFYLTLSSFSLLFYQTSLTKCSFIVISHS